MIFVDTGVFVALAKKTDENYQRAVAVYAALKESGETLVLSEGIFGEVVNFLRRKEGTIMAVERGEALLQTQEVILLMQTEKEAKESLPLLKKYQFASYTDALTLSMMQSRGIKKIASFDSEFDKVPGIERIF